MTDHPITPPPELVQQWDSKAATADMPDQLYIATQAARWGADQELEACCEWLRESLATPSLVECFRTARRPKPPSLKEQALTVLDDVSSRLDAAHENLIRRALEQLDD